MFSVFLIINKVGNISADLYFSQTETENSSIVWADPNTDYLISIAGYFTDDELIELANNVTYMAAPRPE